MLKVKKVLQRVFSIIAIFTIGTIVGLGASYSSAVASLEGYSFAAARLRLPSSTATSGNATSGNATSGNATSGNATSGNATSGNATTGDICIYDYMLSVQDYKVWPNLGEATDYKTGKKTRVAYMSIQTFGARNVATYVTLGTDNPNGLSYIFTSQLYPDDVMGDYVIIPDDAIPGVYTVKSVLLIGENYDGTRFSRSYSTEPRFGEVYLNCPRCEMHGELISFRIDNVVTPEETIKINEFNIESGTYKAGKKLDVHINTDKKLKFLKLTFRENNTGAYVDLYAKSLSEDPYVLIPSTMPAGSYTLVSASLTSEDGIVSNFDDEKYAGVYSLKHNFQTSISIEEGTDDSFIYDNNNITINIINNIINNNNDITVTVNAEGNSVINEELFNAIKGTNKSLVINYGDNQLVFNGKQILTSKTIDATINVNKIPEASKIASLINDGILVDFSDNGELPGKAKVRVKETNETRDVLGNDKVYVYYYNESENKFNEIAEKVAAKDGYYEFEVSHHSSYVLVKEKLDASLITTEGTVVKFNNSLKENMLYVIIGVLVVLLAIAIVTILVVQNKKRTKKEDNSKKEQNKKEESKKDSDKEETKEK